MVYAMQRNKRIFISDIHISGVTKVLKEKYKYDPTWLSASELKNVAGFFDYLNISADVKEVILLGDIFDNWIYPYDILPPTFDEIIKARRNAVIIKSLKFLSQNKNLKVLYIGGNHDMGITKQHIEEHFPGMIYAGRCFRTGRLLAEHGHYYCMFTAPDYQNVPKYNLPIGYFISRAVATKAALTGSGERRYETYMDDLIDIVGPKTLSQCVFEAVCEEAFIEKDAFFKLRAYSGMEIEFSFDSVKRVYQNLYDQWENNNGTVTCIKSLLAETGMLEIIAQVLLKQDDNKVIVMGHSHKPSIIKYDNGIYANCGAPCEGQLTYIETEKGHDKYVIRLNQWNEGKEIVLKEEST